MDVDEASSKGYKKPQKISDEVFHYLIKKAPRIPHAKEALQLLCEHPICWDLLLIPFNEDVASSMPSPKEEEVENKFDLPAYIAAQIREEQDLSKGEPITDEHRKALRELYLSDKEIADSDPVRLKELSNLKLLYLANTQITDEGLVHLKELSNLEVLDLSNTKITDLKLEHLKELSNLKWLDLRKTQVTEDGVAVLKKALPNCEIIWK